MPGRKPHNPDTINVAQAATMLNLTAGRVVRLRREGLLQRLPGHKSLSRTNVQAFIDNPWINTRRAAEVLGVTPTRVAQLANEGKIPVHHTLSGVRIYKLHQLEVVANARHVNFRGRLLPAPRAINRP